LIESVKNVEPDYSVFGPKSDPFITFLKRMIKKDQNSRATVEDLIEDPYLTNNGDDPIKLYNDVEQEEESPSGSSHSLSSSGSMSS